MAPGNVRHYNLRSPSSKESKSCWTRLYCLINFISSTDKLNTQSKTLNNFLTPRFLLQFQTTVLLLVVSLDQSLVSLNLLTQLFTPRLTHARRSKLVQISNTIHFISKNALNIKTYQDRLIFKNYLGFIVTCWMWCLRTNCLIFYQSHVIEKLLSSSSFSVNWQFDNQSVDYSNSAVN